MQPEENEKPELLRTGCDGQNGETTKFVESSQEFGEPSNTASKWKYPSEPLSTTPTSVIIASISDAGVTSKAGFHTSIPGAAMRIVSIFKGPVASSSTGPLIFVTSEAGRSSMTISSPDLVSRSIVVRGAATRNFTPWCFARTAKPYVPILFAVSPLAATRSAPTTIANISLFLLARSAAAIESVISVDGILSCTNSNAVSRAPWLYGLVSVQYARPR